MSEQVKVDVNFFFGDHPKTVSSTGFASRNTGYCVWEWKKKKWTLKKNRCLGGCQPQEPMVRGRFEGQFRAVICIPSEYAAE